MSVAGRLGRYEILSLIGRGAMGAVYKARDPAIDRLVAIKTVGGALSAWTEHQDEFVERFRREAQAAGRLTHPHIVSVYDLGVEEAGETPFIVMEYVAGVSLATLLKENPQLPVEQAFEIVEQIASALDEAHRNGVVHRDIKPANIFLDQRGRVKVGDFGIARVEGSDLTQPGVGLGTPGYLAPELLRGAAADPRTDLYALGVVAYQVLTGKKPFDRTPSVSEAKPPSLDAIQILSPHVLRPEIPEAASLFSDALPGPGSRRPTGERAGFPDGAARTVCWRGTDGHHPRSAGAAPPAPQDGAARSRWSTPGGSRRVGDLLESERPAGLRPSRNGSLARGWEAGGDTTTGGVLRAGGTTGADSRVHAACAPTANVRCDQKPQACGGGAREARPGSVRPRSERC